MVNTTRRFKLEYTNSNGEAETIAELGQDTSALTIDRFAHYRKAKNPDILKVWLEGENFGEEIPTRKSEFGQAGNNTDEPEILLKQYDPDTDSFDTKNRFYAKNTGSINEQGQLALKLYSFMQYTAEQQVNVPSISDTNGNGNLDNVDALNAVLPTGYVADVPSAATPVTIGGYSVNARREKALQELTRDYNWTLTYTGELDANNDYKVKYEPEGFGGTVDTLISNEQSSAQKIVDVDTANDVFVVAGDQTDVLEVNQAIEVVKSTGNDGTYTISSLSYDSTNNETDISVSENVSDSTADGVIFPGGMAIFKAWEKDKTESIVNKVTVVGTEKGNPSNQITETATNSFQLNEFGERFKQIKVGYLTGQAHAQEIAQSYLVPGKDENGNDIEKVPESGTVKTTVYSDNVVNDSFQVVDNTRNINDTFTCVEQRNYWPEGATEIEFEFEQENLEKAAREKENLRDERARLFPSSSTDVGNQNVDADTEDVSDQYDADSQQTHPHGNPNSTSEPSNVPTVFNSSANSESSVSGSGGTVFIDQFLSDVGTTADETDYTVISISVQGGTFGITSTPADGFNLTVDNLSTGDDLLFIEDFIDPTQIAAFPDSGATQTVSFVVDGDVQGDTIRTTVSNFTGTTQPVTLRVSFTQVAEHEHLVFIGSTDGNVANLTIQTNSNDSTAGDTTSLSASGSTDPQNINVAKEDKTDR
ncbi:hypothetical protein OSG_eHP23_00080 [environmental Halophage eHP-23]|nr:hypothetical protein OSG_eHP23_00080 [environmental Halophage eHP-23]